MNARLALAIGRFLNQNQDRIMSERWSYKRGADECSKLWQAEREAGRLPADHPHRVTPHSIKMVAQEILPKWKGNMGARDTQSRSYKKSVRPTEVATICESLSVVLDVLGELGVDKVREYKPRIQAIRNRLSTMEAKSNG